MSLMAHLFSPLLLVSALSLATSSPLILVPASCSLSENVNRTYCVSTALHAAILDSPPVYNPNAPPQVNVTVPIRVNVSLNVFKIEEVSIARGTLHMNAWLRQSWYDDRLSWDSTMNGLNQTTMLCSNNPETTKLWVPDLEMYNAEASLSSFADQLCTVYSSGYVFWSRPGSLRILCSFAGLGNMPFDVMACALELGGWANSGVIVDYFIGKVTFGGAATAAESFQEYSFVQEKTLQSRTTYYYPNGEVNEPWPVLKFTFFLGRARKSYINKILVPNILFAYISFGAMFFDVQCGERLSFGITILLAMVAVDLIAAELLPISKEWLWIEAMNFVSIFFAFAAMVQSCMIVFLYYRDVEAEDDNLKKASDLIPDTFRKLTKTLRNGSQEKTTTPAGAVCVNDEETFFEANSGGDDDAGVTVVDEEQPRPNLKSRLSFSERITRGLSERSRKRKQEKINRSNFMQERGLRASSIEWTKSIDYKCRFFFFISYSIFLIIMFATEKNWSKKYIVV